MPSLNALCVFTGSRVGRNDRYREAAIALGGAMASRKIRLVFGGGNVGLMGVIADTVLAAGGEAVGVIPEMLKKREVAHQELTELHVVESMHTRKALMARLSDGFVAMPGGLGTLEELFEVLTWSQLGIHSKPCGLLNVDGYYDGLVSFVDRQVREGFVAREHRELLLVDDDPIALLERLADHRPTTVTKDYDRA